MGALANVIRPRMDAGRSLVAGMAMIMLCAASAEANVTYEYTGNDFTNVVSPYTTNDHVTVSFTVANPFGPNFANNITQISFSFSDGVQTLTNNTVRFDGVFGIATDASGNIAFWGVDVLDSSEE